MFTSGVVFLAIKPYFCWIGSKLKQTQLYLGPPPNHPGKVFCHRGHQTPMGHIAHPSKIGHNKISFMKHFDAKHLDTVVEYILY